MLLRPLRVVLVLLTTFLLLACSDDSESRRAAGVFTPLRADTLTVATEFPAPGFWEGPDIEHITGGYEYELALALVDRLGLDHLRVVPVTFPDLIAGRAAGFDVGLAQVSVTSARQKDVDFSISYLTTPVGVVAKPDVTVPDLAEARTQRWGVVQATTEVDVIDDLIDPNQDARVYATDAEALAAVVAGEVDVVAIDFIRALAEVRGNAQLALAAQITAPQRYAAVLPDGSSNDEAVSSAIRALRADGTLADLEDDLYDQFDVDLNAVPTIRVTT